MSLVDEVLVPEMDYLSEMVTHLEGILCNIAYGGGAEDLNYIKETQEGFDQEYKETIAELEPLRTLLPPIDWIVMAYGEFMTLQGWDPDHPENTTAEIIDLAHHAVQEYLIAPCAEYLWN